VSAADLACAVVVPTKADREGKIPDFLLSSTPTRGFAGHCIPLGIEKKMVSALLMFT
jgi:hypothetical protein